MDLLFTPDDVSKELAQKIKSIRQRKKISRKHLAARSNVSFGSLRRFEETGKISLESFIKISMELGVISEINNLFSNSTYESIDEVINDK